MFNRSQLYKSCLWFKQLVAWNTLLWPFYMRCSVDSCWQTPLLASLSPWPLELGKWGCHTAPGPHNRWSSSNIPPSGNSNKPGDWLWLSHSFCVCSSGRFENTSSQHLAANITRKYVSNTDCAICTVFWSTQFTEISEVAVGHWYFGHLRPSISPFH